jgi:hypothetical protein
MKQMREEMNEMRAAMVEGGMTLKTGLKTGKKGNGFLDIDQQRFNDQASFVSTQANSQGILDSGNEAGFVDFRVDDTDRVSSKSD